MLPLRTLNFGSVLRRSKHSCYSFIPVHLTPLTETKWERGQEAVVYTGIPQTILVSLSGPLAISRGVWLDGHNRISKLKYKRLFPERLLRPERKMLYDLFFNLFFPLFFNGCWHTWWVIIYFHLVLASKAFPLSPVCVDFQVSLGNGWLPPLYSSGSPGEGGVP